MPQTVHEQPLLTTACSNRVMCFLVLTGLQALVVLQRLGLLIEGQELARQVHQVLLRIGRSDVEELAAKVHPVYALVRQPLVHLALDAHCVVRKKQRVNVEVEWHRGVAQFPDPVHWVQAASHADLDYSLPKGTDVGDHVDVASAGIRGSVVDLLNRFLDVVELEAYPVCAVAVALVNEALSAFW